MIYTIREFNNDWIDDFIEKINSLKEWEKVKIYIDSNWWDITARDTYLDIIKDIDNIELIAVTIWSAGFSMFDMANCKKSILKSTTGMVHHEAWSTDIWFWWTPRGSYEKFKLEYKLNKKPPEYKWMTKKEKQIYDNGDNVYLDEARLLKIFNLK